MPPKKEDKKKTATLPRGSTITKQVQQAQQSQSGPPITIKKGNVTKKGKRGLGSKQTWVEIQINPSQFHYYEKEGGKLVKTMPISPEGTVEVLPAKKNVWGFSYNELERPWPFSVPSEKEQSQWAGAFQYAIISATPRTAKSTSMYKDAYTLHDAGQQVKSALTIKDRPYTGDGQVFMKESYVSVAGQRLMELTTAVMDLQQGRAERPGGAFWNETIGYYNDLIPLCKTGVAALTRKLTAHNTIERFKAFFRETIYLVQQGKTRAAEKRWLDADAVAGELFADDIYKTEKKDALIGDVLVFKNEYEKDKSQLEKLIFESRKRDAAVVAELRNDAVERALYILDRTLVVCVRPYNTGKGFMTSLQGRQADQALERVKNIFEKFLQDLKSSNNGQLPSGDEPHSAFIKDTRRRLWQAEGSVSVLKDRISLHALITDFVEVVEEMETLIYQGAMSEAEEEWKKADGVARKVLKFSEAQSKSSSEGEDDAMSSLMNSGQKQQQSQSPDDRAKGFIVREDIDSFNAFYKVTQARVRNLFLEAKKISESADREKGTGVALVNIALNWLSFSLLCAKRAWTFKLQPVQQLQQTNPRYHECTWLNLNGVSWNDVAIAQACADSLERTLQVIVVYFSFDGFDKFRKEWETVLRASRETIRQLQTRVVAQEECEKFLVKSLSVDYFLQAHLLEDARNAWAQCDAIANSILDRQDFRQPGDGNTYLPDIQLFNVLFKQRADKIKGQLSSAMSRKNYVTVKPLFSNLLLGGGGGGSSSGSGGYTLPSSLDSPTSSTSPFPTSQSVPSSFDSKVPASPAHNNTQQRNPFPTATSPTPMRKQTVGEPGSPGIEGSKSGEVDEPSSPGKPIPSTPISSDVEKKNPFGGSGSESDLGKEKKAANPFGGGGGSSDDSPKKTVSNPFGGGGSGSEGSSQKPNPFGSSGSGSEGSSKPNPFGGGNEGSGSGGSVNPFGGSDSGSSRPSIVVASNPFGGSGSGSGAPLSTTAKSGASNPFGGGAAPTTSSKPNNPFG